MIEIDNLTKIYSGSGRKAVDGVTFAVRNGEIFGFLGPNGAGKSTTIKCLTGMLNYTEGTIKICGSDIKSNPVEAKRKIGYVPDEHVLYEGLTGRQYVYFVADVFGVATGKRESETERLAEIFGLKDKLDDPVSSYSHGMKQKISIISALVHDPEVFVLDEPMMGLDPASSYNLKQLMREYANAGKTVFFSSHVLDVVEKICDRVAIINEGKIIAVCDMQELKEKRSDLSLEELFLKLTGAETERAVYAEAHEEI